MKRNAPTNRRTPIDSRDSGPSTDIKVLKALRVVKRARICVILLAADHAPRRQKSLRVPRLVQIGDDHSSGLFLSMQELMVADVNPDVGRHRAAVREENQIARFQFSYWNSLARVDLFPRRPRQLDMQFSKNQFDQTRAIRPPPFRHSAPTIR
jgi:hypothetical protein